MGFSLSEPRPGQYLQLKLSSPRGALHELYKNEPPLDTYKSGTVFHISPPRFIDVVRRRLELSLDAMQQEIPKEISYSLKSGAQVRYDGEKAGKFLRSVYQEIFERPRNISKIIEALAARNVRQSLDMFMSILTSGHMSEELLARLTLGGREASISEYTLIKILMRGDNRFYNDTSGVISNIFHCDVSWKRPSNLICIEVLYWLIGRRKLKGDNGHMGYFSVSHISNILEGMGFVRSDVIAACEYLVSQTLVEPDTLSLVKLGQSDCIKVTASGFIHMRILSERIEYLHSILPTTPINSESLSSRVFDAMVIENRVGRLSLSRSLTLVKQFGEYLSDQRKELRKHDGYGSLQKTGADYIIGHIEASVDNFSDNNDRNRPLQQDFLDTI